MATNRPDAFIVSAVRTPVGRYGGGLAGVRPDDLAAIALKAALAKVPSMPSELLDDVILGCANQAGEDNRNVARMAVLLAGLSETISATTVNRLCGSGLDACNIAARSIAAGEGDAFLAGGVESMSRAPFVMPKAAEAYSRDARIFDTTIGWRFTNPALAKMYHPFSMGETAENVAEKWAIAREDQDAFALESQRRWAAADAAGRFADELAPVSIAQRKAEPLLIARDEHPRPDTTIEKLAKLSAAFREGGTVTAGNSSGVNDGAAALVIVSGAFATAHGLTPLARIVSSATAGVDPACMGVGPVPASRKALTRAGLAIGDMDVIELNEAFAAQSLACIRDLGLDPARVNPNGGAIAIGHPLGASGARLLATLTHELRRGGARYGLATMCIGVGQGIATIIERV